MQFEGGNTLIYLLWGYYTIQTATLSLLNYYSQIISL